MSEILSQDEIDALLSAVESEEFASLGYNAIGEQYKVQIYDFRRPIRFSKKHLIGLLKIHERFEKTVSNLFTDKLGIESRVRCGSVDQIAYEEFIRAMPNPTTIVEIDMAPLPGKAILEIDPTVTFSILSGLLGGELGNTKVPYRKLTYIECGLMEGISLMILGCLRETWPSILDLRPRLIEIHDNPNYVNIILKDEQMIYISLETQIGDKEAMMSLCYPYPTLRSILKNIEEVIYE